MLPTQHLRLDDQPRARKPINRYWLSFSTVFVVFALGWLSPNAALAQEKFTFSGFVKDSTNGEALIGANIRIAENNTGAATNEYGFFSLTAPKGTYTVVISYTGYDAIVMRINLDRNITLSPKLPPTIREESTVVITGDRPERNVTDAQMGKVELSMDDIKNLPVLFGEVDVLKTIKFIPGVQNAGEGNAGFYVRGGGPDQNLVLLDEATVYNATHLFGFFSVFNGDAVSNIALTKGGMPANYGGRVSSVLAVQMKEGNNQKFTMEGGLGLIASRLTLQGPIKKDKASFIVSARRTYLDILVNPFIKETSPVKGSGYYFYDLNAKANWVLSPKDRVFLSGYFGRDVFSFVQKDNGVDISIPWGNQTATARWNHVFSPKLFMNATGIFSNYVFESAFRFDGARFALISGIQDFSGKVDFDYIPSTVHRIKFGAQTIRHRFQPGSAVLQLEDDVFNVGDIRYQYGNEYAYYVNDEWTVSKRFTVNGGIRYSMFDVVGPYFYDVLDENRAITSQTYYGDGEHVKTYGGIEPRLTLRYITSGSSSVKVGFTRNLQYIHLASTSGSTLPTDVWIPSSLKVKPQDGLQYSIGYFKNFKENKYESSVEFYYKDLKNLIEFRDGATQDVGLNLENDFVFGTGQAYGMELFFKKRTGQFNGWIGYTLAWANRTFPDINRGETFFAKYDRRHDLSVVAQYDTKNKKWTFGGTFSYATGNTFTMPTSIYFFEGAVQQEFSDRNGYRFQPYHRMDLAATYRAKPRTLFNRKLESSWTFSIYNVYSRLNPFFIYIDQDGSLTQQDLTIKAKQVSLFPIIPTATWNFKF